METTANYNQTRPVQTPPAEIRLHLTNRPHNGGEDETTNSDVEIIFWALVAYKTELIGLMETHVERGNIESYREYRSVLERCSDLQNQLFTGLALDDQKRALNLK